MDSTSLLTNYRATCGWVHLAVKGLSDAQLLKTPPGHRNNILWNVGHLVVDNAEMLYPPSGLASPHSRTFTPLFRAGSSPSEWSNPPEPAAVVAASRDLTERVIRDYEDGRFAQFDPAKTRTGWPMKDLDQTFAYVTIHEAIHLGIILSLRKLVG